MLSIQNLKSIEGKGFQLGNGKKYIIGIAREYYDHYSFVVCPLSETNVAIISGAIIFDLQRKFKFEVGGYPLTSSNMKRIARVTPGNLTLENFILELHIQTGMVVNNR